MLAALNDFFESPIFHKGTFVDTRKEQIVEKPEIIPPNKTWKRYVPENKYESLPIDSNEPSFLDDVRVRLEDLSSLDPAAHRKMLNALHTRRFFILSVDDQDLEKKIKRMYQLMADFFACSVEFKREHGKELLFGTSNFVGYHQIEFTNEDNVRDPEFRDVFSVRLPHIDEMNWPENPDFKSTSLDLFAKFYETGDFLLKSIGTQLAEDETVFTNLLTHNGDTKDSNPTSNFSLFRYYDKDENYTTTQRCMIHQDSGLLTLIPKSTFPGLELLNLETKVWIPIEKFIKANECVVYCGETMQRLTKGFIPAAVHRVVREPQQIRYSMPLELKSNEFCELRPLAIKEEFLANAPIENLFDDMAYHYAKCDWCHDNIFGVRYKCKKCPDYDLCSKCIDKKKTVHPEHYNDFEKMTKPLFDPLCNYLEIEDMTALEFTTRINSRRSLRKMWRRMEMFDE